MAQAPIGSSTRKRKDARLHLHSQSVFPEVSCSQQAISLIDAVWINFPGSGRLVSYSYLIPVTSPDTRAGDSTMGRETQS